MQTTSVSFALPAHTCDCHVHVFPDPARFPFATPRGYTPPIATAADLRALHQRLGVERVVIVQPSVYGTDNAATLDGLRALGPKIARGIAVIGDATPEKDLDEMHAAGVRGIRLNLTSAGRNDPATARERLKRGAARVKRLGWHVQILSTPPVIRAIRDAVADAPVPVVFDHFGGALAAQGVEQEGFADLVALVASGRAWVKISGAYRASTAGPDYADAAPLARALIQANADRVVWGTDWPHPNSGTARPFQEVSPPMPVDDGRLLNQLPSWAADAKVREKILASNPARLYGF